MVATACRFISVPHQPAKFHVDAVLERPNYRHDAPTGTFPGILDRGLLDIWRTLVVRGPIDPKRQRNPLPDKSQTFLESVMVP